MGAIKCRSPSSACPLDSPLQYLDKESKMDENKKKIYDRNYYLNNKSRVYEIQRRYRQRNVEDVTESYQP
jgi:hypothetical protein